MRHPHAAGEGPANAVADDDGDRSDDTGDTADGASDRVWKTFLRSHALVTRRIEADLIDQHQLSLVSFDVLDHLGAAPGQRLRMAELADRLVVSRSGVTRAVDRLVSRGFVTREPCDSDLRGTYAAMTREGHDALQRATPTHEIGVRTHLLDALTDEGAGLHAMLMPVLTRLAD